MMKKKTIRNVSDRTVKSNRKNKYEKVIFLFQKLELRKRFMI